MYNTIKKDKSKGDFMDKVKVNVGKIIIPTYLEPAAEEMILIF